MLAAKLEAENIKIACAGWTVAKEHSQMFPPTGTHLERYATLFNAVEINTTFYRLPKVETFAKWRDAVPDSFRFAVKMPKDITHVGRLKELGKLSLFMERVQLLGEKLGPVLIQLPPSLGFEPTIAKQFFAACRLSHEGVFVLEPRHLDWFTDTALGMLEEHQVALVAADPALNPVGTVPSGWLGVQYFRLHGTPHMYYSSYEDQYLDELRNRLLAASKLVPVWVVFDNTASGAAVTNGLYLKRHL